MMNDEGNELECVRCVGEGTKKHTRETVQTDNKPKTI